MVLADDSDAAAGNGDTGSYAAVSDAASLGSVGFFARLWGAIRGLGPGSREVDERRGAMRRR